ncbi:MAG: RNA polymerase subunit sigma-70 [Planctomycetes bacterium]|nr:RNA polymerase subunit sigma-70 [Planctomycetota bacterium]
MRSSRPRWQGLEFPALSTDLYQALRVHAGRLLRGERRSHTLQPTALVHEACLRVARGGVGPLPNVAAYLTVMRRVLIDHGRRRQARLRAFAAAPPRESSTGERGAALRAALRALAVRNPRAAQVVELRWFGEWSTAAIARFLGITERSVRRDEAVALLALRDHLRGLEP